MPNCRACGAKIEFIKMFTGNWMPCETDPVPYWRDDDERVKRVVTHRGYILPCKFAGEPGTETGLGYIPHWESCPGVVKTYKAGRG